MTAPVRWLSPQSARTGKGLERRTVALIIAMMVIVNLVGAVAVFAFAGLVGAPELEDTKEIWIANAIALVAYVLIALAVGIVWGTKRLRLVRHFLREERAPGPEERRAVLRAPGQITLVMMVLWGVAVIPFTILNATFSLELAVRVGGSVFITGLTTSAIAYFLAERLLRAATVRALAAELPERPAVPGVAARGLIAWMLGSGVALIGLTSIGISTLVEQDFSRHQLALVVVVMGAGGFVIGLALVLLAARATADPVRSVRDALARVEKGDLETEVPVYDGSEVGLLQAGFNRMVSGLRDRERIREAFGTYIDRDVAEHILAEGPSLEGEEVEVTLMFLDIRNFTSFAEQFAADRGGLDPEPSLRACGAGHPRARRVGRQVHRRRAAGGLRGDPPRRGPRRSGARRGARDRAAGREGVRR